VPGHEHDVIVIGAGVAGLTATASLALAGRDVLCLEAGNRVGGRILTVHDALAPHPIELGAEFIHGFPAETWAWIRREGLTVYEHSDEVIHMDDGHIVEARPGADRLVEGLRGKTAARDESFEDYLRRSRSPRTVREWARAQVEGFNAARSEVVSTVALSHEASAAEAIQGERSFRLVHGYDSLPQAMLRSIPGQSTSVRLNSQLTHVEWRRGIVRLTYRSLLDGEEVRLRCRRLIVTVSAGVLQSRTIEFDPEPRSTMEAAESLQFGQVYRVTFRFREPFWLEDKKLKHAGFLISTDPFFRAWWTTHPVMSPVLTGWAAGSAADQFRTLEKPEIVASALQSLSRILGFKVPTPEAAWFHNWEHDPLFRGAYSYVPVGQEAAHRRLAAPVEDTLYFAGEASEWEGHASTVHGAIRSGKKAAELVMRARV
jgi:monoamine oxidase